MRIGLSAIFRDEAKNLPRFFSLIDALDADSRVDRLFCSFYENDSLDETPQLLASWLKDRPGLLQSEKLSTPRLRGREITRTICMAEARNHALDGFADEHLDWLVVIDPDIHANTSHIWQLIDVVRRDRYVSMACASALQNIPDLFGHSPWSYYDSFALLDRRSRLGITGAIVPVRDLQERALWMAGRPVPVQSAFGGIAVTSMATVRSHRLRWDGSQGCEHWSFCIGAAPAGQVVACPQVNPLVLHAHPRPWSDQYLSRRRLELKKLWRQGIC